MISAREDLGGCDLDAITVVGDFKVDVEGRVNSSSSEGPSQTVSCFCFVGGVDSLPAMAVNCDPSTGAGDVLFGHAVEVVCLGLWGDTSSLTML